MTNYENNSDSSDEDEKIELLFHSIEQALNEKDAKEFEETVLELLDLITNTFDNTPSPWLQAMELAHRFEGVFNWDMAEKSYLQAIQIAEASPALQYNTYETLSSFYKLFDKKLKRLEAAQNATQAAIASDLTPIIPLAWCNEAYAQFSSDNLPAAKNCIDAAIEAVENLTIFPDLQRCRVLLARANYFIHVHSLEDAQKDLDSAHLLIQPWTEMTIAAGWQGVQATWWASTARIRQQNQDAAGATSAWQEVIMRRQVIAQLPQLEGPFKHNALAVSWYHLGKIQNYTEPFTAENSFKESDRIRAEIGLPSLRKNDD